MDATEINKLLAEYERLQNLKMAETAGLYNQRDEIYTQIDAISAKYTDKLIGIENKLGYMLYIAENNNTLVHIYFMLKEAAENCYKFHEDDHYFNGFYEGMKEIAALFLTKEKLEEIDPKAQAKYPKAIYPKY